MTDQELAYVYDAHSALIHKEVWSTLRLHPAIPQKEILSEAYEIFCRCCRKWENNRRSKFSTYLTNALRNGFKTWRRYWYEEIVFEHLKEDKIGVNGGCGPERLLRLKQALEQMSPVAVEIINLVFSPPTALELVMREKSKPIPTKEVLRQYLRNLGIGSAEVITNAFSEITQTLEEV